MTAEELPQAPACAACGDSLGSVDVAVCPTCLVPAPRTTGRRAGSLALEIRFEDGTVVADPGQAVVLGRHGTHGSRRALGHLDQVSRRHALVHLDADGTATIRDEGSTNGTYLDDQRVGREWEPLPEGARLRLGADVHARVRRGRGRDAG